MRIYGVYFNIEDKEKMLKEIRGRIPEAKRKSVVEAMPKWKF